MATVSLRSLRKQYPSGPEIVKGIDLDIEDGEFVTLVGPSGCGKSTTLNLIAGLEYPSGGEIRIGGEVVNDRIARDRDLAMVFQSYALYPHMDVRRNIAFPLQLAGLDRAAVDARVRETAARVGIEHLLDRKPRELSGGQRQRVALARALVRRPKAFLFDEPLSNLDAALRVQMRAEIKKLHEELGATFIYVTHDQVEAMSLSDRVVVLNKGYIQQVAPPREIYARPSNLFVAEFFGAPKINILPADALGIGGGGRKLVAGIRPENLEVGVGAAPERTLSGTVDLVELMGPETWVTLRVGESVVTARGPASFEATTGAPAWARWDPGALILFDAATGERVDSAAAPS